MARLAQTAGLTDVQTEILAAVSRQAPSSRSRTAQAGLGPEPAGRTSTTGDGEDLGPAPTASR